MSFEVVTEFEEKIAEFFGAPYAVAVDSATSGMELCLRHLEHIEIHCPRHTYVSVPMLAKKLGIKLTWKDVKWVDYYYLTTYPCVIDAAVLWERNSYVKDTFMCLSFQYQKHLNLSKGGMILCPTEKDAIKLKKLSYDGRIPNTPWREQNIDTYGYHYYMEPEKAALGLQKLPEAIATKPKQWTVDMWPDVSRFKVFNQ
jgi:dTDP-4-amino-4,6-dideoxygalactose transaminase